MRNILIRANSSSKIGLGHIKRDLVLAKKYKDDNICFAVEDLYGNINHEIKEEYAVYILKSNNVEELIKLISDEKIDLVIIDSYDITYAFEKELKEKTRCELMVFDDTYEKHYCDILLNHNIYAKKNRYKNLVPSFCEVLCGSEYTLIRDEFKNIERKELEDKKVFICMGGSDEENISKKILRALVSFDLNICVVTSSSNKNIKSLQEYESSKVKLYIDSNKMAELMSTSSFCIVSPSVILNEVLYLNKKFISIQSAQNQEFMQEYLEDNSYLCMKEFNEEKVKEYVSILLKEVL